MIDETIDKIEERLRNAQSIPEERKAELLQLLVTLRSEVGQIAPTHSEAARTIAGHTERSTAAATEVTRDDDQLQESLDNLSASVTDFEKSHPKLVQVVNRICVTLSNLGI
jgi:DNA repair exonuclease SbcCD ATPase subunit